MQYYIEYIVIAIILVLFICVFVKLQKTSKELKKTKAELEDVSKKYYAISHFDEMSELLNRTAYVEMIMDLKKNFDKIKAEKKIIIFMADLNFLKYLNTNLGHQIGDEAIKNTAKIIKDSFSEKENCYRIGGDEFCVISIGSDQMDFENMYNRFLEKIKEMNKKVNYPFSVASAYYLVRDESLSEAMQIVDNMMYENKVEIKKKYPHFSKEGK